MAGIKDLKPDQNSRFKQMYYVPINKDKYKSNLNIGGKIYRSGKTIICRSSWEFKFCKWLDLSPEIIEWASEPLGIRYISLLDNREHTYYPDFYYSCIRPDGSIKKYLVECKPSNQLEKPLPPKRKTKKAIDNYNYLMECYLKNSSKKIYAKKWCLENNIRFVYLTEKSNLNNLEVR